MAKIVLTDAQIKYREALKQKRANEKTLRKHQLEQIIAANKEFNQNWEKFKQTNEFTRLKKAIESYGMKSPYSENILYRTYYSGYWREPFIKS